MVKISLPSNCLYFVRVGVLGQIGRFTANEPQLVRGQRVVCRTNRGLELGEVLSPSRGRTASSDPHPTIECDGRIERCLTAADNLWLKRIKQREQRAFRACVERLRAVSAEATLVEIECLFDGKSLYFHFLGKVTPEVSRLTQELADAYDGQAHLRRFAEAVDAGCGPLCGTGEGGGCGDSCSGCAVAGACGESARAPAEAS